MKLALLQESRSDADQGLAPLRGVITEIGRRAPAVSSYPVIVMLENAVDDVRSGMAVDVQIDIENAMPEEDLNQVIDDIRNDIADLA